MPVARLLVHCFINLIVFSFLACRTPTITSSKMEKDHSRSNSEELMEAPPIPLDPNAPEEAAKHDQNILLLTEETPCISKVSQGGSASVRALREALSREFLQRICKKIPDTAKPWRTNTTYLGSSWASGIDLTAVTQNVPRGTAVTSRHVLYTKHYGYHGRIGQTLNFLTMNNEVVSRKIVDVKYLSQSFSPDLAVIRLDLDLPDSITPMRVLSSSAASSLPDHTPILRIDQENKALISAADRFGIRLINTNSSQNPPGVAFSPFYESMITGDSSSPSILLLQTKTPLLNAPLPILFGLVTFSGPGSGPEIAELTDEIHAAIASFGDSHVMTSADPATIIKDEQKQPSPQPPPQVAPTCTLTASRIGRSARCNVSITVSGKIKGAPALKPAAPTKWSRSGSDWRGVAGCPVRKVTLFQARLSGPTGSGGCAATPVPAVKP